MTRPKTQGGPDEQVCLSYCRSFYDYEECKQVCLSLSHQNSSLFIRARRQAEADGLPEEFQTLFAAGAVWGYVQYRKEH